MQDKLTNWAKEPTLISLKQELEQSRSSNADQTAKINHWNALTYVKTKPDKIKNRSTVQPKLIRRQAEWRYSALTEPFLSSNKLFTVTPVTFEDYAAARQNELLLNWQFRTKINKITFLDQYIKTAVDEGSCLCRVGWKCVTEPVEENVPRFQFIEMTDEEQFKTLQQVIELKTNNPREYEETVSEELKASADYFLETDIPAVAEIVGYSQETVEKVVINHPTVDVLDMTNVYIDPSCNGKFEDALFIITAFEVNKADLQGNGTYINLDSIDWSQGVNSEGDYKSNSRDASFTFSDKTRKKAVMYEYWGYYDINDNGKLVPIVVSWIGNTVVRIEESPYPDGKLPFVLVNYLPVKRSIFGEPDAELLEDAQKITGALSRGLLDLLGRSANSQIGYAKGLLDPLNKRRFDAGDDYEFNPTNHPDNGIITHKYPEIPNSAITLLSLQNNEAEALTGVKSFSGGISGSAYGDVAAGIRGALDASSKREMAILRRMAKGIVEIGNKIIAMNAVFLSDSEVIRVTNSEFVTVNREDLQGNFDLAVDISTAEVDQAKSQDLAFILQTLGNSVDTGITLLIMSEIAELKRMPTLAEKLKNYQPPPPDPIQQQLQQLELKKLELEIAKLQAQANELGAKSDKAKSEADLNKLAYADKLSGNEHEKALELQKGQAKGNQQLEITKAILNKTKAGEGKPDVAAALGYHELLGGD